MTEKEWEKVHLGSIVEYSTFNLASFIFGGLIYGGFIIKSSVGGGHLLNFLGSILSVYKFKVVGNKYDKEGKV